MPTEICNYYSDCTCAFCGEDRDYSSCDFINLFCEDGSNTFTSKYSNYKSYYLNYFKRERDAEIFCGDQKPAKRKSKRNNNYQNWKKLYSRNKNSLLL